MSQRNISIATCFNYTILIQEQLRMISEAGFTHFSIGERLEHSNFLNTEGRKRLIQLAEEYSLKIDTLHGCRTDLQDSIDRLTDIAEAAADLGINVVVIHVSPFFIKKGEVDSKVTSALNVCKVLETIAKTYSIKFAIENVHPEAVTDVVKRILPELDEECFGFCYDSSHDQIDGPRSFDLLERFSNRLIAVHISDRIKEFVDHVIPGEGFINFNTICNYLSESRFHSPLLLELMTEHSKEKEPEKFLNLAFEAGKVLYDKIK